MRFCRCLNQTLLALFFRFENNDNILYNEWSRTFTIIHSAIYILTIHIYYSMWCQFPLSSDYLPLSRVSDLCGVIVCSQHLGAGGVWWRAIRADMSLLSAHSNTCWPPITPMEPRDVPKAPINTVFQLILDWNLAAVKESGKCYEFLFNLDLSDVSILHIFFKLKFWTSLQTIKESGFICSKIFISLYFKHIDYKLKKNFYSPIITKFKSWAFLRNKHYILFINIKKYSDIAKCTKLISFYSM